MRCPRRSRGPGRPAADVPEAELPHGELADAYRARWGAGACFQMMKDRLQMEAFAGTKPLLIEQDIHATAYLLNVAFDLANEADLGLPARPAGAHRMTVNRSYALGVAKEELVRAFLAPPAKSAALMESVVEELKGCLVPVRPGREYGRTGLNGASAPRHSTTHKRVF